MENRAAPQSFGPCDLCKSFYYLEERNNYQSVMKFVINLFKKIKTKKKRRNRQKLDND